MYSKKPVTINLDGVAKKVSSKQLTRIWKSVQGYDNYQVNPVLGIRNAKTGKVLKGRTWLGYPKVTLIDNGKKKEVRVHRVVAETFLPKKNPSYNIVNHINGDRSNFSVHNLEWMDQSLNMKDRWANAGKRKKYLPEYGKPKIKQL